MAARLDFILTDGLSWVEDMFREQSKKNSLKYQCKHDKAEVYMIGFEDEGFSNYC